MSEQDNDDVPVTSLTTVTLSLLVLCSVFYLTETSRQLLSLVYLSVSPFPVRHRVSTKHDDVTAARLHFPSSSTAHPPPPLTFLRVLMMCVLLCSGGGGGGGPSPRLAPGGILPSRPAPPPKAGPPGHLRVNRWPLLEAPLEKPVIGSLRRLRGLVRRLLQVRDQPRRPRALRVGQVRAWHPVSCMKLHCCVVVVAWRPILAPDAL